MSEEEVVGRGGGNAGLGERLATGSSGMTAQLAGDSAEC